MRTMWILATETLCQGVIPSVWEGDGKDRRPVLFTTSAEAQAEAEDWWHDHNDEMRHQREAEVAILPDDLTGTARFAAIRAICEDYQPDDAPMDWPLAVTLTDDDVILHPETGMPWPLANGED